MRLTNYFIKKKVQSLASGAASRKHEFCTLEDAGHILVLYQANDSELVEPCLDVLRKKNKKVQACVYVTGDLAPETDASYIPVHAKKDVSTWLVPSDAVLERFRTIKAGYPDRSYASRLLPDAIPYATASLWLQGGSETCRYRFV